MVEVENRARTILLWHPAISLPRERRDDRRAAKNQLSLFLFYSLFYTRSTLIGTERIWLTDRSTIGRYLPSLPPKRLQISPFFLAPRPSPLPPSSL